MNRLSRKGLVTFPVTNHDAENRHFMIIIYNLKGLLVGLAGLAFGILILFLTRSLTLGIVAITMIWMAYGRSTIDKTTQEKIPAASVFFIPLFYWGILTAFLVVPAIGIDFIVSTIDFKEMQRHAAENADPREALLRHDEKRIAANLSDDPILAQNLKTLMAEVLPWERYQLGIRTTPESQLILMSISKLKKIDHADRQALLDAFRNLAEMNSPDKKIYIGIKGSVFYGAISTPTNPGDVRSIAEKELLFDFYGPKPTRQAQTDEEPVAPASALFPENVPQSSNNENVTPAAQPAEASLPQSPESLPLKSDSLPEPGVSVSP